jgi:uncharacterized protein
MSRVLILSATGSLGSHVLRQAIAAGYEVTVLVRDSSRSSEDIECSSTAPASGKTGRAVLPP